MQNKFFKKYKINQLQNIQQKYKYIYVFRYNDLKINEIISIKKTIKNLNFKSLVLKQNITNKILINTKGQGALLIIYSNENKNLISEISIFKKLKLILLIIDSNIYSNLKLKHILLNSKVHLNIILIKPLFNFLYYLRKL